MSNSASKSQASTRVVAWPAWNGHTTIHDELCSATLRVGISHPLRQVLPETYWSNPAIGKRLHELQRMAAEKLKSQHIFTADELNAAPLDPPLQIVPGLFTEYRDVILGGAHGDGKTTACVEIGINLALGLPLFGLSPHTLAATDVLKPTRSYKVMYFDLELGKSDFQKRMSAYPQYGSAGGQFIYVDAWRGSPLYHKIKFDDPSRIALDKRNRLPIIRDEINQVKPEIVIVDNLKLAFMGQLERSDDCMKFRAAVDWLYNECASVKMFLFPTHLTKPTLQDGKPAKISLLTDPRNWLAKIRGSGALLDHFTVRLGFAREEIAGNEVCIINGNSSHAEISPIILEQDQSRLFYLHPDGAVTKRIFSTAEQRAWEQLPTIFGDADIQSLGKSSRSCYRALAKAKANGGVGILSQTPVTYEKKI